MKRSIRITALLLCLLLCCSLLAACGSDKKNSNGISQDVLDARKGVVRVFQWEYGTGYGSSGTGFFIGKDGEDVQYIVTNHHVVYEEPGVRYQYEVVIDGQVVPNDQIEAIWASAEADLAIIKLKNPITTRVPLTLKDSDLVEVTENVYAIGFPANSVEESYYDTQITDMTVTQGMVTRNNVSYTDELNPGGVDHIQINDIITHGNSGGPLVTEDGYVVGVNTWGHTDGTAAAGYAIQVKYIENLIKLIPEKIEYEKYDPDARKISTQAIVLIVAGAALLAVGVLLLVLLLLRKKPAQRNPVPPPPVEPPIDYIPPEPVSPPVYTPPEPVRQEPTGGIRILDGALKGSVIPVENGKIIWLGKDRTQCSVVFDNSFTHVSRAHCSVGYNSRTGEYLVTDNSSNGTFFFNRQRLAKGFPVSVQPGTILLLANENCRIQLM